MFLSFQPGDTDYKIFKSGVKDLTDSELIEGAKKAVEKHRGRLYPKDLIEYAKGKSMIMTACHKLYSAPEPKDQMTPEARKAAMKKLREEVGI